MNTSGINKFTARLDRLADKALDNGLWPLLAAFALLMYIVRVSQ